MMSTTLRTGVLAVTLAVAALCAFNSASAQTDSDGEQEPGAGSVQLKQARPNPNALQAAPLDPKMLKVLQLWESRTAKIKRLHVKHTRRVYDSTYFVEKVSEGELYFDAPDRGRIDIRPIKPGKGQKSARMNPETGEPYAMEADVAEQWICDGNFIYTVNEADKVVEEMPLPGHMKGQNIMDGPMPFLFGMPVEQAKRRYDLKFSQKPSSRPPNEVWLDVKPRLEHDAATWSSARLILDSETFLPLFVKMVDPIGNLETVYTFSDHQINPLVAPWNDKYKPPRGGGWQVHRQDIAQQAKPACPSLIGLSAKKANEVIQNAGYEVGWIAGDPARNKDFEYVVYEQVPPPNTPLPKGQIITLKVYNKVVRESAKPVQSAPEKSAKSQPRSRTATK